MAKTSEIAPPDSAAADCSRFVDPWNTPQLLAYYRDVAQWHGYIRFLGLPHLKDNPDVEIDRLYVQPRLSERYISPDSPPEAWPETSGLQETLVELKRLVLLGDPGSGKSSLVSWLANHFTRGRGSSLIDALGPLIPLPMIVRELDLSTKIDTWDKLLACFLNHDVAAAFKGKPEALAPYLESGQALILLDGVDELASVPARKALRNAVHEGMRRYPDCRWIMTSRIVGYEDVELSLNDVARECLATLRKRTIETREASVENFDELFLIDSPSSARFPDNAIQYAETIYLAPFDDARVEQFAHTWYTVRSSVVARTEGDAADLVKQIRRDPGTRALARIPNLLTMMALIHRVRAALPDGRAQLYSDIADAYLWSIDEFRGLTHTAYSRQQKKQWLAHVAFQMQLRRTASDNAAREVLVNQQDLVRWLAEAMEDYIGDSDERRREALAFVDYIGRRSGLLLPRGQREEQEHFAFMHLTIQEFFAACYLEEELTTPDWLEESADIPPAISRSELRRYTKVTAWKETILLLFELLHAKPKWGDKILHVLFGEGFSILHEDRKAYDAAALLAEIACDPYTGLSAQTRTRAIRCLWEYDLFIKEASNTIPPSEDLSSILICANPPLRSQSFELLLDVAATKRAKSICIRNCEYPLDFARITALPDLDSIAFIDCTELAQLPDLAGLIHLRFLCLSGCTGLTQLPDLAGLGKVTHLDLSGCTGLAQLPDLAGLSNLRILFLSGCTGLTQLPDLAGLSNLHFLFLSGCTGLTQLPDLQGLTMLGYLAVRDCPAAKNLPGYLRKRKGLEILTD